MKKPTNEFSRVSEARKAAIDGLQTYADRVEIERELQLLRNEQRWSREVRSYEPTLEYHFRHGKPRQPLSQATHNKLRAEFLERRQAITDRFDEQRKEIQRVKEIILDRFNEKAKARDSNSLSNGKRPQRSMRSRNDGRER